MRIETAIDRGTEVTPYYDPLLAKVIARGDTREAARTSCCAALAATQIAGVETNRDYLLAALAPRRSSPARSTPGCLEGVGYTPRTVEVMDGGTQTTVQDHPGRLGYWDVGVPPSGPMDALSFRLGNRAGRQPRRAQPGWSAR